MRAIGSESQLPVCPASEFSGMLTLAFWAVILTLLAATVLFGGTPVLILALAVGLAVVAWVRPQEAPAAGMLYLFACNIVLPSSARFDGVPTTWELVYWASGLLIITSAACCRIGIRRVFDVPVSAKVFLLVAFVAGLYGRLHGATASYVARQFYGVLLLVIYMGISLQAGSLPLLVQRIRTFGVLCAALFYIYFLAEFSERGFHREQTTMGSQAAMMAILLIILGLEYRRMSWSIGAVAVILAPALIFQRRDILTFVLALPLALGVSVKSKVLSLACWAVVGFLVLPGLLPSVAQSFGGWLEQTPYIGRILPEQAEDSDTLLERTLQLGAAVSTVQAHPWLGAGLGGDIEWVSPEEGLFQGAYVDNGWAYLLQKMGLVGAVAFVWFLVPVVRSFSRESLALSVCLASILLVTMFSEPVFFHFTTAPFVGTMIGLLLHKKYFSENVGLGASN